MDCYAVLLASLLHDFDHPGTSNSYQINASSTLAIRYNDISVLENHHCAKAFEIIHSHGLDIFSGLQPEQKKFMRKAIIALILSTDMTQHFSLLEELESVAGVYLSDPSKIPPLIQVDAEHPGYPRAGRRNIDEKPRLTIMKSILHVADISNPARPWEACKKWSDLVLEEFFMQGDKEKAENLPVSMNCDRSSTFQDELSINFADFIVTPFFFSLTRFMPKMIKACKMLESNRQQWNQMLRNRILSNEFKEDGLDNVLEKWDQRTTIFCEKIKNISEVVASFPSTKF